MIRTPPISPLFPSTPLSGSGASQPGVAPPPPIVPPVVAPASPVLRQPAAAQPLAGVAPVPSPIPQPVPEPGRSADPQWAGVVEDRKSTRLNSSHANISYAVF